MSLIPSTEALGLAVLSFRPTRRRAAPLLAPKESMWIPAVDKRVKALYRPGQSR